MIEQGQRVTAVRDGKTFQAGTSGLVTSCGMIECERYLMVLADSGLPIGPSLDSYWQLEGAQPEAVPTAA